PKPAGGGSDALGPGIPERSVSLRGKPPKPACAARGHCGARRHGAAVAIARGWPESTGGCQPRQPPPDDPQPGARRLAPSAMISTAARWCLPAWLQLDTKTPPKAVLSPDLESVGLTRPPAARASARCATHRVVLRKYAYAHAEANEYS